jgi:hypothetical protein
VLDRGEPVPAQGHLHQGDEGGDAALAHHLLMLVIGRVAATGTPVQRVEAGGGAVAETDDGATGDRVSHNHPFALRVGGDDGLVPEGEGAGDEGFHGGGFPGTVGAEYEDVGGEGSAVGGVAVGLPGGEVPQRVSVQVHTDDRAAGAEAGVGDERVDPRQMLRRRLMRRHHRPGKVPVVPVHDPRPERSRYGRFGESPFPAGRAMGGGLVVGFVDGAAQGAALFVGEAGGLEDDGAACHHFIPNPIGRALTMRASACWQYRICASIPARANALRIPARAWSRRSSSGAVMVR